MRESEKEIGRQIKGGTKEVGRRVQRIEKERIVN